jgi:hypothetical protein
VNSTQRRLPLLLLAAALLVALSGCEIAAVGESEQIANVQTVLAGTPSVTATPTETTTAEPTATLTPTIGPSPTPTDTPIPSATPLPPTPTPNPALAGFSFCDQRAGSTASLFSASLAGVEASGTPAYEQVVLRFELGDGSAPLGATASCLAASDLAAGTAEVDGDYVLRVGLPGWLRDSRFTSSITETVTFTGTRTLTGARLVAEETPDAGAALLIGLTEPLPFRLSVERNPTRLVIAVARSTTVVASSDQLGIADGSPSLDEPLFVIFDGDIWRVEAGEAADGGLSAGLAGATNLTNSPETETALTVSADGSSVAFCRAAPGLDPADAELPVPSALWVMGADGADPQPLAQVGVSCADPAFSPDGSQVAFAVDETGATPIQRTIYTVPAAGGEPARAVEGVDEWSRFAPQWLAGGALAFAAEAQDGRSTLFLRDDSGRVSDIGAALLVQPGAAGAYARLGRPLAAPDGSRLAVELIRPDNTGADLAILAADGDLLELIGAARAVPPPPTVTPTAAPTDTATPRPTRTPSTPQPTATATEEPAETTTPTATATIAPTAEPEPEPLPTLQGPYWTRPLAWDSQGRLLYLSTLCASQVVQDYQVYSWAGAQRSELILTGQSFGSVGAATMAGDSLAYVLAEQPAPGPRGALAAAPRSPAALWIWDLGSGARAELLAAERDFTALAP